MRLKPSTRKLKEMERVNKEVAKMAAELAKRSKYVGGNTSGRHPGTIQ